MGEFEELMLLFKSLTSDKHKMMALSLFRGYLLGLLEKEHESRN